jgi:hypothetical protein
LSRGNENNALACWFGANAPVPLSGILLLLAPLRGTKLISKITQFMLTQQLQGLSAGAAGAWAPFTRSIQRQAARAFQRYQGLAPSPALYSSAISCTGGIWYDPRHAVGLLLNKCWGHWHAGDGFGERERRRNWPPGVPGWHKINITRFRPAKPDGAGKLPIPVTANWFSPRLRRDIIVLGCAFHAGFVCDKWLDSARSDSWVLSPERLRNALESHTGTICEFQRHRTSLWCVKLIQLA